MAERIVQVAKDVYAFDVKVKADKDGQMFELRVEFDFTGWTREALMERLCNASSPRVALQAALRQLGEDGLEELANQGKPYRVLASDAGKVPDSVKLANAVAKMDKDEALAVIEEIKRQHGL